MAQSIEEMKAEVEFRTRLKSIKALMETLKLTAENAMEALEIPQADRAKYLAKI